jgi:uncharacterized protein
MHSVAIPCDPHAPQFRVFDSAAGPRLLVIPHSRIFAIPTDFAVALRNGDPSAVAEVEAFAGTIPGETSLDLVPETTPQSISLNVSSSCNLGCNYCYARGGGFDGAQTSTMTWEVGRAAVDRLLTLANPAAPITIGFIGGEPFLNRKLVHRLVEYAASHTQQCGPLVRFSVTTNGTVLNRDDIALIRNHPFAITVSIDGGRALQEGQRPMLSGRSSFAELQRAITPLLEESGLAKIAARATVTRDDLSITSRFDEILRLGFSEVGFSPVRSAAPMTTALHGADWSRYLDAMIALADRELVGARAGVPLRLTNLAIALKQLHRGFAMPFPCGAGGGYFSVGADGTWYACHRAIGQEAYALGDNGGLDQVRRSSFLRDRHVHSQRECRSCWARYLCSGGCHHEASARDDSSCGFVRGWLDYCLRMYSEISGQRPNWFDD